MEKTQGPFQGFKHKYRTVTFFHWNNIVPVQYQLYDAAEKGRRDNLIDEVMLQRSTRK